MNSKFFIKIYNCNQNIESKFHNTKLYSKPKGIYAVTDRAGNQNIIYSAKLIANTQNVALGRIGQKTMVLCRKKRFDVPITFSNHIPFTD